jgi:hypothetical protein
MGWMENLDTHPASWNGLDGTFHTTSHSIQLNTFIEKEVASVET